MKNSIGYQLREYGNDSNKLVGGSFGGSIDLETIDRLVGAHLDVITLPSGNLCFADKQGRKVTLKINVDPIFTAKGKAEQAANDAKLAQAYAKAEELEQKANDLMRGLSWEEIIRKLEAN